jgi:twitching motility protein PilT
MMALVDLVNRTRPDHIITLEHQIATAHDNRRALISQREVRGGPAEMAAAIDAALREDPDLLVVDDIGSPEVARLVIDAADAGHLVIAGIAAPSSAKAIERLLEYWPEERRADARQALARLLRGVVAQVLLRKSGGGRLAARELLLNAPSIARLIHDGQLHQLPLALERGRRHGMVPFNDALAAFVQSGATEAREAYRKSVDREGLLNLMKRAGIDTSFAERLA